MKELDAQFQRQLLARESVHKQGGRSTAYNSGTLFSSTLTPQQMVSMVSPHGGCVLQRLLTLVEDKEASFMVVVKNLSTGEQYLHSHAFTTETLSQWHKYLLEKPIFRHVDLQKEPTFPILPNPAHFHTAYSIINFAKGRDLFQIVCFPACSLATYPPFMENRNDRVLLRAQTPLLPTTHEQYRLLKTSIQRRVCALQFAFIELARQRDFTVTLQQTRKETNPMSTELSTSSVVQGDGVMCGGKWQSFEISGGFMSNSDEASCGSSIIPQVLRYLDFLLPGVPSNHEIEYHIIQQHKYGYLFAMPHLAQWQIWGAVNMAATIQTMQEEFVALIMDSSSQQPTKDFSTSILSLWPTDMNALREMTALIQETKNEQAKLFESLVQKSTQPELKKVFPNVDAITTEEQRDQLTDSMWHHLLAYTGLSLILPLLEPQITALYRSENLVMGDWLLRHCLTSKTSMTQPQRLQAITILFQMCLGLATVLTSQLNTPDSIQQAIYEQPSSITFLSPAKVTTCMQKCIGTPPTSWYQNMAPFLFDDVVDIARFVLSKHSHFANFEPLFPTQALGVPPAVFKEEIRQATFLDLDLHDAYDKTQNLEKGGLARALAFLLLTADQTTLHQWSGTNVKQPPHHPRKSKSPPPRTP